MCGAPKASDDGAASGGGAGGASSDAFAFGGMLRVQQVDKTAAVYRPVVLGTEDEAAAMAKAAAVVEVEEAIRKPGEPSVVRGQSSVVNRQWLVVSG